MTVSPSLRKSRSAAEVQPGAGGTPIPLSFDATRYSTGAYPWAVALGDFNGDGKPDLATANLNGSSVSVLLGNGDGTFQPHVDYAVGPGPDSVTVGDLNGDGKPDLMIGNYNVNTVSVLLGNGDGTFQTHVDYAVGPGPYSGAAGDLNGDGKLDLVVANRTVNTVSVLLGNGDGTFQTHVDYAVGNEPLSVAAGDLNGDGKLDLVVANLDDNSVSVLLGNGDGTFQTHVDYAVGYGPYLGTVGDLNGDGKPDLVITNYNADSVSVLLGNGDGTFQPHVDYATGKTPLSVKVGDFNGDGNPDLATANFNDSSASVLLGNGDGTFQTHVDYPAERGSRSVGVGDFNGDSKLDFVVANGYTDSVSVLINTRGAATRMELVSSQNPSNFDQAVTFTATITPQDQGTPTGTVGFSDGTTTLGNFAIDASGIVSLTTSTLTVGIHSITATYSGDQVFAPNTSTASQLVQGGQPAGTLIPATLNFAAEPLGVTSTPQNLTLTNTAYTALNISSIGITGANGSYFAQSNNCGASLPVSGSCNISVTFTPETPGNTIASLSVTDNAADSPQSIVLSGTGKGASVVLAPSSITFPSQYIGTSGLPMSLTVTNVGNDVLMVNSVTSNVADFGVLSNCTNPVDPGTNCTIGVFFDPTAPGTRTGTLLISDNGVESPHSVSLSGAGQDFSLASSGSSTATISAGQSASYTVAISPGGGFNQAVALGCSGAPAQSRCSLSSNSIKLNGSTSTPVTVTVTTAGTSASLAPPATFRLASTLALWFTLSGLSGLVALNSGSRSRERWDRLLPGLIFLCVLSLGMTWSACGSGINSGNGGGGGGTPPGTYNVTVTGTFTSGSTTLNHAAKLTLIVR